MTKKSYNDTKNIKHEKNCIVHVKSYYGIKAY